ncbi:PKS-NRPS hybrid synthetase cheA [Linum grandiflorum]
MSDTGSFEDRDFTEYFVNKIHYDTCEDACNAAKDIARGLEFSLIKGSYKQNCTETMSRLYMYCSHGYKSTSYVSTVSEGCQRVSKTRKLGCKFKVCVKGKRIGRGEEWKWLILPVKDTDIPGEERYRGFHNHKPELYKHCHPLTKDMKNDIREMEANQMRPSDMKSLVNNRYDVEQNITQIYNETAKIRVGRLSGNSPTKWFLAQAKELKYFTKFTVDKDYHLSNVFICHPESVRMLHAWYFVVLIDSTYKTNIYRKPVVQLIGVTPVRKNFNIGLAIVTDETTETYTWILQQLKTVLGERVPTAFVTDKEQGLGAALLDVFPTSAHLLCVWHMKRNISGYAAKLMDDRKDLGDAFVNDVWGNVLYAYTEGWFWTKWAELAKGGHAEALVDYLQKEWIPCRHRWAHYHTNKVFHLGNTSTNRVESSHSSLKSWLHGSTHKTDTFFLSYHGLMESQGVEIRKLLEDSRLKVFTLSYT